MYLPGDPLDEPLLTVQDLAKLLKVSKRTIWRWLAQKRLPEPIRYSRSCLRWKAATIRDYLEGLSSTAEPGLFTTKDTKDTKKTQ